LTPTSVACRPSRVTKDSISRGEIARCFCSDRGKQRAANASPFASRCAERAGQTGRSAVDHDAADGSCRCASVERSTGRRAWEHLAQRAHRPRYDTGLARFEIAERPSNGIMIPAFPAASRNRPRAHWFDRRHRPIAAHQVSSQRDRDMTVRIVLRDGSSSRKAKFRSVRISTADSSHRPAALVRLRTVAIARAMRWCRA
jgi:hypothetical protein